MEARPRKGIINTVANKNLNAVLAMGLAKGINFSEITNEEAIKLTQSSKVKLSISVVFIGYFPILYVALGTTNL